MSCEIYGGFGWFWCTVFGDSTGGGSSSYSYPQTPHQENAYDGPSEIDTFLKRYEPLPRDLQGVAMFGDIAGEAEEELETGIGDVLKGAGEILGAIISGPMGCASSEYPKGSLHVYGYDIGQPDTATDSSPDTTNEDTGQDVDQDTAQDIGADSKPDVEIKEDVEIEEVETSVCESQDGLPCKPEGIDDENCGWQVCNEEGAWEECEKINFGTDENGLPMECDEPCGEEGLGECYTIGKYVYDTNLNELVCDAPPPKTPEPFDICNGKDEDCDGLTDEDIPSITCGVGACTNTIEGCVDGIVPECAPKAKSDETCDTIDNDCDELIDEDLGATTCGLGVCEHTVQNCINGIIQFCDPMLGADIESCNGVDDNCDGQIDDGFLNNDLDELCDDIDPDDDNDGILDDEDNCPFVSNTEQDDIDEDGIGNLCDDNPCDGPSGACECTPKGDIKGCGPITEEGECQFGTQTCENDNTGNLVWGECKDAMFPTNEICDGKDNDCNALTDEGLGETACGTGICEHVVQNCINGLEQFCDPMEGSKIEMCNGQDDDCDGITDGKTAIDAITYYFDGDGDGFGNNIQFTTTCEKPDGPYVEVGGDLDDNNDTIFPGAPEICDGIDNDQDFLTDEELGSTTCGIGACENTVQNCINGVKQFCDPLLGISSEKCNGIDDDCNGLTDEESAIDAVTYYLDSDGDGFGDDSKKIAACEKSDGPYVDVGGDIDDNNDTIFPGAPEICDGIDNDQDFLTDEELGSTTCGIGACENTVQNCINGIKQFCDPLLGISSEKCNGIDDDCNGVIDEASAIDATTYYLDEDADGFGDDSQKVVACEKPDGPYVEVGGDVDDNNDTIFPGAPEICDGIDNDQDLLTDEELGSTTCGTGVCENMVSNCIDGIPQKCEPLPKSTPEICDGKDNDCNGTTDEGLGSTTCGIGACENTVQNCINGIKQFCDPLFGISIEKCNGVDDDCNGETDEESAIDAITYYLDSDGDGFGNSAQSITACKKPDGPYIVISGDLNDNNNTIFPGAPELCDGFDNDQDLAIDEGLGSSTCGTGPCENTVQNCFNGIPQACEPLPKSTPEICDGKDNDCDTVTDEGLGSTTCGLGECNHSESNCIGGTPNTCNPLKGSKAETCDGKDNDCDGTKDDGMNDLDGDGICDQIDPKINLKDVNAESAALCMNISVSTCKAVDPTTYPAKIYIRCIDSDCTLNNFNMAPLADKNTASHKIDFSGCYPAFNPINFAKTFAPSTKEGFSTANSNWRDGGGSGPYRLLVIKPINSGDTKYVPQSLFSVYIEKTINGSPCVYKYDHPEDGSCAADINPVCN